LCINSWTCSQESKFAANEVGDYGLIPTGQNTLTNLVRLSLNETAKIDLAHIVEPIYKDFEGRQVFKYGATMGLTYGNVLGINLASEYEVNKDPDS